MILYVYAHIRPFTVYAHIHCICTECTYTVKGREGGKGRRASSIGDLLQRKVARENREKHESESESERESERARERERERERER